MENIWGNSTIMATEPCWMVEIYLTAIHKLSTKDIYVDNVLYQQKLIDVSNISESLPDGFYGITELSDVTISCANLDGYFSTLFNAEEIRNKQVLIMRYDGETITWSRYGTITGCDITDEATFTIRLINPDPLQTLIPPRVMSTDDWTPKPTTTAGTGGSLTAGTYYYYVTAYSSGGSTLGLSKQVSCVLTTENAVDLSWSAIADAASYRIYCRTAIPDRYFTTSNLTYKDTGATGTAGTKPNFKRPDKDLGKAYCIPFGWAKKVPMRYISSDFDNNRYDYICYGIVEDVSPAVYRDGVLVDLSEYTFFVGTQTAYSGFALIRFIKEQRTSSGGFYEITADMAGLTSGEWWAERRFIKVIQMILSNSTWGLNLPVNVSSFDTAAAEVSNLYCDGHIESQKTAASILEDLQFCSRSSLMPNIAGEYEVDVDKLKIGYSAGFGRSDGYYENIVSVNSRGKASTSEAVKSIKLEYRKNENGDYMMANKRTVFDTFGEEKVYQSDFVRNHETADRITCYWKNRFIYADEKLSLDVAGEGIELKKYDLTVIAIQPHNISGTYQVEKANKGLMEVSLDLCNYSASIYDYTIGDMPVDENADEGIDYSKTAPDAPTAFTMPTSGTYQSTDGTTMAFFQLQATAPTTNFARMVFGYKKNAETIPYTYTTGELSSGLIWKGRIDGLIPGMSYDLCARAENAFGVKSGLATLTAQVASGDTTAPAQVTGLTGSGKYKTWHFEWTQNTESDLKSYHVQIGTSGFGTVYFEKYIGGNSVDYTDDARGYGTLYCRVKAVDFTGNESASWSSTASATTAQIVGGGVDVTGNTLTYVDILNNTISQISLDTDTNTSLSSSYTTLCEVSITTILGDEIFIIGKSYCIAAVDGFGDWGIESVITDGNDTVLDTSQIFINGTASESLGNTIICLYPISNISAGSQTFKLRVKSLAGTSPISINAKLWVLRIRR